MTSNIKIRTIDQKKILEAALANTGVGFTISDLADKSGIRASIIRTYIHRWNKKDEIFVKKELETGKAGKINPGPKPSLYYLKQDKEPMIKSLLTAINEHKLVGAKLLSTTPKVSFQYDENEEIAIISLLEHYINEAEKDLSNVELRARASGFLKSTRDLLYLSHGSDNNILAFGTINLKFSNLKFRLTGSVYKYDYEKTKDNITEMAAKISELKDDLKKDRFNEQSVEEKDNIKNNLGEFQNKLASLKIEKNRLALAKFDIYELYGFSNLSNDLSRIAPEMLADLLACGQESLVYSRSFTMEWLNSDIPIEFKIGGSDAAKIYINTKLNLLSGWIDGFIEVLKLVSKENCSILLKHLLSSIIPNSILKDIVWKESQIINPANSENSAFRQSRIEEFLAPNLKLVSDEIRHEINQILAINNKIFAQSADMLFFTIPSQTSQN